MRYVVFTDLDGTLLDAIDFNFAPAEPVLETLRERGIPLVIVTSKTLAEVTPLADQLQLDGPLVVESGGAVAVRRANHRWTSIPLGTPAAEIRALVPSIEEMSGARLMLYSQMSRGEAELISGLSGKALERSMQRQFDEPFILVSGQIEFVASAAESTGLAVRDGGRLHHLTGRPGKGDAVRRIVASLEEPPVIIALGDAPMDAEFLALADIPIIIRGIDGLPNRELLARVPHATIAPDAGPCGWARALAPLLDPASKEGDGYGPN